jgi:DNA-binding beta-propeller fold protein YncE
MAMAAPPETELERGPEPERRLAPLVVAVVVAVALGGLVAVVGVVLTPEWSYPGVLVTGEGGTVARLDGATGEATYRVDQAVVAPDGSAVYRVDESGDEPVSQRVDPATGSVEDEQVIPPRLEVRVVGVGGTAAVLMPEDLGRIGLYTPTSRSDTELTVVWSDERPARSYRLEGNFEPETFTVDGSVLYLLEFTPPTDPTTYSVRQLDLESGEVTDVYSPEVELNPEMRGHARAQAIDPDGRFMYTLYTVGSGPTVADAEGEARTGFVHVISLERDWSFCIFLPLPMGRTESGMGLAMDPAGEALYVVDGAAQLIAEIDPEEMVVTRSVKIASILGGTQRVAMAASTEAGRLFLADDYAVYALDTDNLRPTLGWTIPAAGTHRIEDIRISDRADELWVLATNGVHIVDLGSMEVVEKAPPPLSDGSIGFVAREVRPTSFDEIANFVCAC